MNWALQHVKAHGWRGVVNMSLGSAKVQALNDAAQYVSGGRVVAAWQPRGSSWVASPAERNPAHLPAPPLALSCS